MTTEEVICLPMCSLCAKPPVVALKKCGKCRTRTYCNKRCQTIDWKHGHHKHYCGKQSHANSENHQPWCAYLDRDPELDNECGVESDRFKSHPSELITTGMNTCLFVVVKSKNMIFGWHASLVSLRRNRSELRRMFESVSSQDFVSGYIVPGEDREAGSLNLKRTCRTMQVMPYIDPAESRTAILDFLQAFPWWGRVEIMAPVTSYKDFVVFDMVHRKPYTFRNTALFDQGCTLDAGVASPMDIMLSGMMR